MSIKVALVRYGKPKFREPFALNPKPKKILDIGVANDSYLECKAVFPDGEYHGLDFFDAGIAMQKGDRFIQCNLDETPDWSLLPGNYDLIIINHVLEHLRDGPGVLQQLCRKLAPGGILYVEVPSIRTAFKRKSRLSYHFHDDPTHISVYSLETLANVILRSDCKLVSCGPISTPLKSLISVPRALLGVLRGQGYGPFLLHMQGKIDHIMAIKPVDAPAAFH